MTMSAAPILAVRRAIVAALKADAALTALVPEGRIFGEKTETGSWPFIRCSEFESDGSELVLGNIHVFSRKPFADEAHQASELVGLLLDDLVLELADGRRAHVVVGATRLIADPEESTAWHSITSVQVDVPRDCSEA